MIHDKVEEVLRRLEKKVGERAQKSRMAAEKLRAQRKRSEDAKTMQNLDRALDAAINSRDGYATASPHDPVNGWKRQQWDVQKDMKARGFMRSDEDGWHYVSGKLDRQGRPAEKLAKGELKFDRWARFRTERNEAMAKEQDATEYYHRDVLNERYKDEMIESLATKSGADPSTAFADAEKAYRVWRKKELRNGIEEGFLQRNEKGQVCMVDRRTSPIGPAEKLVTGRTKGVRGRGPSI